MGYNNIITGEDRTETLYKEPGGGLFYLLCSILIIYGTAVFLTIAFSLVLIPIKIPVAWCIVGISIVVGVLYYRWIRPPNGIHPLSGLTHPERRLMVAWLVFYFLLWILAYILPDSENDGLWYHNPPLHFWALKGRIHWITADYEPFWNDLINYSWNGYAKEVEAIGFLFLRAVPVSRFLNGINLVIIPIGCLGIATLARFLGARRTPAILAGILFLFIPNIICHAVNLYIGASVASLYIALFAVTAFTIRALETGRKTGKILPALGCALGLAASGKGTAVVLFPLLTFIFGVFWYRVYLRTEEKSPVLKHGVLFLVVMFLIAFLVGGYWYLRNYVHTGTPLYPIGFRIGGKTIFPGVEIPFQFPPPDTPLNKGWPQALRILYSWLDNPEKWHLALTEVSHNSGGLGILWLFGCFPALIWVSASIILQKRKNHLGWNWPPGTAPAWIGICLIGLVLFLAMPPRHNHKARYIIWLYGLGLPAFFLVAEKIKESYSSFRKRWGKIWISIILLIFIGEGLYSFGYQVKKISLSRQGIREGSFRVAHLVLSALEGYPPGYFLPKLKDSIFRRIFPYQESVAIGELNSFPEQKEIIGHLTQGSSFGRRKIYFLDGSTASAPEKLVDFIRYRKIKYVIWNCDIPVPAALGAAACFWDLVPGWFYVLVMDSEIPAAVIERGTP